MNRILIGICGQKYVPMWFWQKLTTVRGFGTALEEGRLLTMSQADLHRGHNLIVADALKRDDWDYLAFFEDDHTFPADVLERAGEYTQDIVARLYFNRALDDPRPVLYKWVEGDGNGRALRRWSVEEMKPLYDEPGIYPADVVPMGCTFIHRRVLEGWPVDAWPWFQAAASNDPAGMTDDVYFSTVAGEAGFGVYVDSWRKEGEVYHWGDVPFGWQTYIGFTARNATLNEELETKHKGKDIVRPKLEVVRRG